MDTRSIRISLALSLGATAGVGIARFGFGPVLPAMSDDLGWSLTTSGAVQSVNLGFYLLGSIAVPRMVRRSKSSTLFVASLLITGVSLMLTGVSGALPVQVVLRAVTGFAAALLWIVGGSLAARLATDDNSGRIIGTFFAGLGTGMVLTGLLLPSTFDSVDGWRGTWFVLGGFVLLTSPVAMWALRQVSSDPSYVGPLKSKTTRAPNTPRATSLLWLEVSYFCFGFGSIGYMTFAVAQLRQQSVDPAGIGLFWAVFGASILVASQVWANPISRSRTGTLAAQMYLVMAAASALSLVADTSTVVLAISGIGFGSVFVSAVAVTTHLIRCHLPKHEWTDALARFTVGFGLALTLGAITAGYISDRYGLDTGMAVSTFVLLATAAIAAAQRAPVSIPGS